jgi:aconitate hydratase
VSTPSELTVSGTSYRIYRLDQVPGSGRLPYSLKVLLENLLRNEDGRLVTPEQVDAVAGWDPAAAHGREVAYTPARVLMQDFTGVPCVVDACLQADMYTKGYSDVFTGDERWECMELTEGETFAWDDASTYVRRPPYFDGMRADPEPLADITGARVLALLGDSVTTDHISPAGAIKRDSPAGAYLTEHGIEPKGFNSYGSRRGNHEVMIRGTFANIRLRNQLAPGTEGGFTRDFTTGANGEHSVTTIFDASENYLRAGTPLVVLARKEYGSGSSRDWAAKGTLLLGVRAVIAASYERIHRSNLIGMGVLPLQFPEGENVLSLGLTGEETFDITGVTALEDGVPETVRVRADDAEFDAVVRIDTPGEADYYRHGGILQYVLRQR